MKSIGVSTYEFCVKDSNNQNLELHDILGESILEIINNAATIRINTYDNDPVGETVYTYDKLILADKRNENNQKIYDYLAMRIKTGEYGVETELVDSQTGNITYTRGEREADVMPFGCCMLVPAGEHTKGIFAFQSIGRYGIVTIVKKYIDAYLRRIDNSLRFVMGPVMPREYASKLFEEGILKSIRIIRYNIPDDQAERYGLDRGIKEVVEERVIRRPGGFLKNKKNEIQRYFNRECGIKEIIQLDNFEMDDLKFEFQNGRRVKTLSLKNIDNLVISEDITEDIILENGHPAFESLVTKLSEIGEYYLLAKGAIV